MTIASDMRERVFQAMTVLSELSRDAGQDEQLHIMYAANRAWHELDRAIRSKKNNETPPSS
jgi:hypothetical protein